MKAKMAASDRRRKLQRSEEKKYAAGNDMHEGEQAIVGKFLLDGGTLTPMFRKHRPSRLQARLGDRQSGIGDRQGSGD